MIKILGGIIKSIRIGIQSFLGGKNSVALLFFPCKEKGDKDAVPVYYSYITAIHRRIFWCYLVDDLRYNGYADIFSNVNPEKTPKSIMLFAHPNDQRDGFLVNPSSVRSSPEIKLDWWKCNINYDLFFAHVCNGAAVLKKPDWREVFPKWLSYSDEIWSFVLTEKGNSCWRRVICSILRKIPNGKSIEDMKGSLLEIYERSIVKLAKKYEPRYGDTLNLMYLENCMQNIKTSEDD